MTTLHVINDQAKHALVNDGDAIIFIENGVYAASTNMDASAYFALLPDCRARAVDVSDEIHTLDYEGFVELCTHYDKVVTW